MARPIEIPECHFPKEPILVGPSGPTPRHSLYLSNLDDQTPLRFSLRFLHLYKKSVCVESLRASLSRVLVDYYPLAGRLKASSSGKDVINKLEVDCNGQGAPFVEGYVGLTAEDILEGSKRPNSSWRKLIYRLGDHKSLLDVPPLVIQVVHLTCGSMMLFTAISHCICDGIGISQFLCAWAQLTVQPNSTLSTTPFHGRYMLKPRAPPHIVFSHPEYNVLHPDHPQDHPTSKLTELFQSQPLVPISVTFTSSQVLHLIDLQVPHTKSTSFEVLASHVWRAWVKSLDLPPAFRVKLLFTADIRKKLVPPLPPGFYGNGFVLGCAESSAGQLTGSDTRYAVKLVQQAKERLNDEYVRSMIDMLEEERTAKPDCSTGFIISQWSKLGLEDLDFGEGMPIHMGPPFLMNRFYCIFLPVIGDLNAIRVWLSVPQSIAKRFEYYLKCCL